MDFLNLIVQSLIFLPILDTIISWDQKDIKENISLSFVDPSECYKVWRYFSKTFDVMQTEDDDDFIKINKEDLESVIECLVLPSISSDKILIVTKFLQNVNLILSPL